MGIVNLTPDSFSGDGLVGDVDRAIRHAREQFESGSDILDIGAESSRPGAIPTPEDEELRRLYVRLVRWAEMKYGAGNGATKKAAVEAALSDQGYDLDTVRLDAAVHEATKRAI